MKHVCIRIFDDYMSAHIILGRLQNESIVCYLNDEITHTIGPFLSTPMGGIKLMVAEQQTERALSIIDQLDKVPES
jgi:hypothetical protein